MGVSAFDRRKCFCTKTNKQFKLFDESWEEMKEVFSGNKIMIVFLFYTKITSCQPRQTN